MQTKKNRLDILFVNPPVSQEERYGIKFKAGGQTFQTGLALLGAITREKGYKTAILDATALEFDYDQTVKKIIKLNPKYVGITAVSISIFNAVEIIKRLNKLDSSIKVILGGPHITAVPLETMKRFKEIKIGVLGEGDITILELIKSLEDKKDLKKINGLVLRDKDKIILTKSREMLLDLDSLPLPAWDMFPDISKHYCPPAHTVKKFPATILITSRGCPGQCTFCDNKVFGRRIRGYSTDYILKMIKHLKNRYGIKEIQFRDDNFLAFKKRTKELCVKMIKDKINIVWSCAGRIDMIDKETLRLMKKAGCWQIWYGIESGSQKVLDAIKKNITLEKIRKTIKETKKAGISPCGFFMVGMPKETEENILKTIKLLLELPLDEFHMCHLTPLPGSEIYETANSYGYFDNDWKKFSNWKTVFVPKGLTKKKLTFYSNLAFRKFYFRPRIIFQYLTRLRSFHHLKIYFQAFMGLITYISQKQR
jgi:radical SAM superfamily enzyme YgiQ (UPF0313 family)